MTRKAVDPRLLGLVGPYAKLAATMSRNWGVEIIPSGYQCSYDGKRIRIPFTSDHLPESMKPVLDGMVDHETLHAAEDITAVEAGRAARLRVLPFAIRCVACQERLERTKLAPTRRPSQRIVWSSPRMFMALRYS